ncbi:hypothetical protein BH10PLA2_BH10PLA2_10730 [soil metagenome]
MRVKVGKVKGKKNNESIFSEAWQTLFEHWFVRKFCLRDAFLGNIPAISDLRAESPATGQRTEINYRNRLFLLRCDARFPAESVR